jgi:uncharacterized protein
VPSKSLPMRVEFVPSISEIDPPDWHNLNSSTDSLNYPFTRYEFLSALESTGCVGGGTGWLAEHALIYRGSELVAAMPSYLKSHSYGEYVFDWSWAQAYAQAGLDYYPKLISAIPFTPVPGPRLLCNANEKVESLLKLLVAAIQERVANHDCSGWHLLFPDKQLADACADLPLLKREDVQFHWNNQNYQSFDDFLATLRSTKRKQLRRERRIVADQGVQMRRYSGSNITTEVLQNFYICYCQTYLRRSGHRGYLTQKFFESILESMADQMMIVLALKDDQAIAASLFFFDQDNLYGRYWGCTEDVDCLHFEACYYQGIDFAIERNLRKFNPGTQGEHKLVRGFEPTKTFSLHWVVDQRFQSALADFMQRESEHKSEYQAAAKECLPFKRN